MLPEHIYQVLSISAGGYSHVVKEKESGLGFGQEVLDMAPTSAPYALGNRK